MDAHGPILYQPDYGWHVFWQDHWPYVFIRYRSLRLDNGGFGPPLEQDMIVIACLFWWCSKSVRRIIEEARRRQLEHLESYTENYQPVCWNSRLKGQPAWEKLLDKSPRPLHTVYLDGTMKEYLVKDLNEFFDPSIRQYCLDRGVPYHRGYLFHGPPGNGKTSMISALAGVFGASIYTISLKSSRVTDTKLVKLFASTKKGSFVVFEDVDDAGLNQRSDLADESARTSRDRRDDEERVHITFGDVECYGWHEFPRRASGRLDMQLSW